VDRLESLHQEVKLPLQLGIYLRADFEAELRKILARNFVVLDQPIHEFFNTKLQDMYLLDSLRMSHSNLSSKTSPPSVSWIFKVIGIRYSLASLGMSMEEKLSKIKAYFLSKVL
jgi:hypothetical protein